MDKSEKFYRLFENASFWAGASVGTKRQLREAEAELEAAVQKVKKLRERSSEQTEMLEDSYAKLLEFSKRKE